MDISISKVKNYSFEGVIWSSELSADQLKTLGLKYDSQYETPIDVIGEFVVNWDDDIPLIEIESISVIGSQKGTTHGPKGYNVSHCEILPLGHPRQGMEIYTPQWGEIPTYNTIDLDLDEVNYDSLCDEIQDSGDCLDWHSDRQASLCDYYYDTLQDR